MAQFRKAATWLHVRHGIDRHHGTLLSSGRLDKGRSWGGLLTCLSSWISLTKTWVHAVKMEGWHSGLISPFSSKAKASQVGCMHEPHATWSFSFCVAHWDVWYIQVRWFGKSSSHSMWAVQMKSWLPILVGVTAEIKQFYFFSTKIWTFYQEKIPTERQFSGKRC